MSAHPREHADWLERAVAGSEIPPAQRGALESCSVCVDVLHGLESLRSTLDQVSAEDRAVLAAAHELRDAPGLDAVRTLSARMRAQPTPSSSAASSAATPRRSRAWIWLAAASVVGLLGWVASNSERGTGARVGTELGSGRIELVAPSGAVGQYSQFSWRAELSPGGWFVLIVRDPNSSQAVGRAPLLEQRTRECSYVVPPEVASSWPSTIEWEVRAYESGDSFRVSQPLSVSRSP